MPLIDAYEIINQYHMYFLTGSHFAQYVKMALLFLLLNLENLILHPVVGPIWGYLYSRNH